MACLGFVCCAGLGVKQPDLTARLCCNLRVPLPDCPRAHHGDAAQPVHTTMGAALRCHLCAKIQRAKERTVKLLEILWSRSGDQPGLQRFPLGQAGAVSWVVCSTSLLTCSQYRLGRGFLVLLLR